MNLRRLSKKKLRISAVMYCLAYGLLLVKQAISNTTILEFIDVRSTGFRIINAIAFVLICAKIIKYDFLSIKRLVVIFLSILLLILSYYSTSSNYMIMLLILVVGAVSVDEDSIVKCHFGVYGSVMMVALLLSLFGIIEDYTVTRKMTGTIRHSFGNTYPTDFAAGILYLELDYFFLKKDAKKRDSLILFVINCIVYRYTDSNTFFIGSVVLHISDKRSPFPASAV